MSYLTTEQLSIHFGEREVVRQVSLDIEPGGLIGLIGPNGAGKTTLMRALAGLQDYQGQIHFDKRSLHDLPPQQRARTIAYLPQGHAAHWPLPAREIVILGRLPYRRAFREFSEQDHAAVERALELTDTSTFADRRVTELSGGERARVMLARALAVQAPILFCDEPVASLDPYHQIHIMEVLREYAAAGASVIAVLHDLTLASRFCQRLLLLHEGRIVADGNAESVLSVDNLARTYHVAARHGVHEQQIYVVPWRRL